MKWSQPADRSVVDAVIAVFREPCERWSAVLRPISRRQWERSLYWLDASGMALYLLDRIERNGLENAMPEPVIARLRQNLVDNKVRSDAMFAEFLALNAAFQLARVDYCNLKGFTLSPDSCPDPALRRQLDFDFLVDGGHIEICREILTQRGYILRGATRKVWEFKTASDDLVSIADFYKPQRQRCAEIHFRCDGNTPGRDERLDRLRWGHFNGLDVPELAASDQFVGQAGHLFGHLCGSSTRLAWLLEFVNHLGMRFEDRAFWQEVGDRAASDRTTAIALGVASLLAVDLFGARIPPLLEASTIARLPEGVLLWAERYGRRAVLADFPGTKLNLILREQVLTRAGSWKSERRPMLVPLHRAPRIIHVDRGAGLWKRLRGELYQIRYDLFRLRFHVVEGLRYAIELKKWRKYLKLRHTRLPGDTARGARTTAEPS